MQCAILLVILAIVREYAIVAIQAFVNEYVVVVVVFDDRMTTNGFVSSIATVVYE